MKILHTSDWHIGRLLYGQKRYNEFAAFLEWLVKLLKDQNIDALIVSGDIFDTTTPSNKAQQLYYQFLCKVAASSCRHVVIIAGNHDSPTFLNAPKELLLALNVHVVGAITDDLNDEIIVLKDSLNHAEVIVCAVPYLRDRDVRRVKSEESIDDKSVMLKKGVQNHYADIGDKIKEKKEEYGSIPVIGMGHLFTTGGKTVEDDGVRELYVGSLAHVGKDTFPDNIDYMALGHLHVPQKVGNCRHIRYSGSPLPMGFSEANQEKSVVIVDFSDQPLNIKTYAVPVFQKLVRIKGTMDDILKKIDALKAQKSIIKSSKDQNNEIQNNKIDNNNEIKNYKIQTNKAKEKTDIESTLWLEIVYNDQNIAANLKEVLEDNVAESDMQILRIKNQRMVHDLIYKARNEKTLDDLNEIDVFNRLLDAYEVLEDERPILMQSYKEIITMLKEKDTNAQ